MVQTTYILIPMTIKYILLFTLCLALAMSACNPSGSLTRRQADKLAAELWQQQTQMTESRYGVMWDNLLFEYENRKMPVHISVFGNKPADGRSLYISMHGGGSAQAGVNDEQWHNQQTLYEPAEGVYIAPRASVDAWDMWSRPFVDTLFERIIQMAVIREGVNPNKVYVMGYSAGGDGTYRLAPRLADHWAAAAMMAGTPDGQSPLNLRNIGFTIWMGQLDSAYHRNRLAMEFNRQLDSLQAADPGGYVHRLNIVPGSGHWMNNADTLAVEWMAPMRRNPAPDRIVWRQEASNPRVYFYYLSIPPAEAKAGMEVRVDKSGNTITIEKNDYTTLYLHLNDRVVDLDQPVTVIRGGKTIFSAPLERKAEHIARSVEERVDPEYIFSAMLQVTADGAHAL